MKEQQVSVLVPVWILVNAQITFVYVRFKNWVNSIIYLNNRMLEELLKFWCGRFDIWSEQVFI